MDTLHIFLCWLGLHKWEVTAAQSDVDDGHRDCKRCAVFQSRQYSYWAGRFVWSRSYYPWH